MRLCDGASCFPHYLSLSFTFFHYISLFTFFIFLLKLIMQVMVFTKKPEAHLFPVLQNLVLTLTFPNV